MKFTILPMCKYTVTNPLHTAGQVTTTIPHLLPSFHTEMLSPSNTHFPLPPPSRLGKLLLCSFFSPFLHEFGYLET